MGTKLEPSLGWVVVRRELPSETTPGGIVKPASALEREVGMQAGEEPTCTVVAVPGGDRDGDMFEMGIVGVHGSGGHDINHVYPSVGDRVVVLAEHGKFVPYFDEENKPAYVTVRNRREPMCSLYFVRLEAIVGVVSSDEEELTDG
jgi:co-chaperonin GroES (HSP10)